MTLPRLLQPLITAIGLLLTLTSHANRADYGSTHLPIWSPLTYFEKATISDLHVQDVASAETLLAIALIASGVRDYGPYNHAQAQLSGLYKQLDKHLVERPEPWLTGKYINQLMHEHLLRDNQEDPPGYQVDQSRLQGIFENGQYNCISSALLYAVIARHYKLVGLGVLLPSHAFIELQLPGGQLVDVETTSIRGYDQLHDEAFYQRTNHEWFSSRNLQPATYEDYLNRERVEFYRLATRNMLNQHTRKQHMLANDSLRLAEISAFLDPNYPLAQIKRLYFYNVEIQELIDMQDWQSLARLFNTTYATVLNDAQRFPAEEDVQKSIQLYLAGAMLGYAHMGEVESTLQVMGEFLTRDWALSNSRRELENRVASAVAALLRHQVERGQFDEALLMLSLMEGHIDRHPLWPGMTRWLYLRWAEDHWQAQRWEDVIFTLKDIQHMAPDPNDTHPLELIESAYFNWVLELTRDRQFDTALGVVEQCRIQIDDQSRCLKAQTLLEQQHKEYLN